jgi:N-sulfoglucosamine sulfohydrolase
MAHHDSLKLTSCLLAWLFLSTGVQQAQAGNLPSTAARKPNVVIFLTDDESWLERSIYGWSKIPTPHFDRVANEGLLFTRCYTSSPVCTPSRASLLTGRNFWELEEGAFLHAWLPSKFAVLPDLLEAGGYYAGYTGKGWGPGVQLQSYSGRNRNPAGNVFNRIKRQTREEGIDDVDTPANFASFLDARPAGKPFYFWVGCREPHAPCTTNNHEKFPARYGVSLDDIKVPGFMPDTQEVRRNRANMLYEVCHADEDLGEILRILEDRGELRNTLLIVTSDNGTDRIPKSKTSLYDWGVHVPLAMMWPNRIKKPGRRVDDFVNFRDFAPTILEAAGWPVPPEMSGRSVLNILSSAASGQVDPTRTYTVTGLEWYTVPNGRTLTTERYQYVVYYDPKPQEELYDLQADPWNLKNLADSPEYAAVRQTLKRQLEAYQRQTKDPRVTGDLGVFERTRAFTQKAENRKKSTL